MIRPLSPAAFCFQCILKSILQVKTENNLLIGHYTLLCACTEGTAKSRNEEMRNEKQKQKRRNEIKLGKARVHESQTSSLYVWFLVARNGHADTCTL